MQTDTDFDFSMINVPDSWHEAAKEAPELDAAPMRRPRLLAVLPEGNQVDIVTSCIAGLAMSFVTAVTWYGLETVQNFSSPWLAVPMALLIAVAVRLGGGAPDPEIRASLSVLFFVLGVAGAVYFVEWHDFRALYGSGPSMAQSEDAIVRHYLRDPEVVVAWVVGVLTAIQTSYTLRRR